jgi:hypothetical protein
MSCKSACKFFFQIMAVLPGEWRSVRSTDFNILTDGGLATTAFLLHERGDTFVDLRMEEGLLLIHWIVRPIPTRSMRLWRMCLIRRNCWHRAISGLDSTG